MADDVDSLLGIEPKPPGDSIPKNPAVNNPAAKLMTRYSDAYRVANAVVAVGNWIKVSGWIVGFLAVLVSFLILGKEHSDQPGKVFIVSVPIGLLAGFVWFVSGFFIAVQGTLLRVLLDATVNTSPHLTNEQKAEIMSLT